MLIIRKIALTTLTIAALSPAISNASPERASAKACAQAFATSLAAPGATAPAFKLDYRGASDSVLADFYPTEYTFTLEAHDKKTGDAIARATCSVNSRGAVTSIAALPLSEKATLAAGL